MLRTVYHKFSNIGTTLIEADLCNFITPTWGQAGWLTKHMPVATQWSTRTKMVPCNVCRMRVPRATDQFQKILKKYGRWGRWYHWKTLKLVQRDDIKGSSFNSHGGGMCWGFMCGYILKEYHNGWVALQPSINNGYDWLTWSCMPNCQKVIQQTIKE